MKEINNVCSRWYCWPLGPQLDHMATQPNISEIKLTCSQIDSATKIRQCNEIFFNKIQLDLKIAILTMNYTGTCTSFEQALSN